jgi:hypothetical protein
VKIAAIRERGYLVEVQIRRKGFATLSETFSDKTSAGEWTTVIEADMVRGVFLYRSEAERNKGFAWEVMIVSGPTTSRALALISHVINAAPEEGELTSRTLYR